MANEVANSGRSDLQQTSETEAARRASGWLETRIPELRAKSEAAKRAVVEYKTEHDIVETGTGQLINVQRVADLNAKWNAARDETFKAKARFDQLAAEVGSGAEDLNGIGNSVISDDEKKGVLATLRNNYFDVTAKEVESSAKLGPNNPNVVALRNQEAQLRSQLRSERQAELQAIETIEELETTTRQPNCIAIMAFFFFFFFLACVPLLKKLA